MLTLRVRFILPGIDHITSWAYSKRMIQHCAPTIAVYIVLPEISGNVSAKTIYVVSVAG